MLCYTDFFLRYCPSCGKRLNVEQEEAVTLTQDYLDGATITCTCGTTCCYFPEHRFPYREKPQQSPNV